MSHGRLLGLNPHSPYGFVRGPSPSHSHTSITLPQRTPSPGAVAPNASAQSKDEVMAAFLLNFARYVEWPEDAFDQNDMPVQFCMLSSKEFEGIVAETVSGKTVADRPVLVRWTSDLNKTNGCHILFIGREFGGSHSKAVDAVDGLSVFTVADQEGFAEAGGVANFLHADNRIRFEINPTAAKKAGLKISSRLLTGILERTHSGITL